MSVQSDTVDIVEYRLAQLSALQPDEIAVQFETDGIWGARGSGTSCPLAQVLVVDVGEDFPAVRVQVSWTEVWLTAEDFAWTSRITLPYTVGKFVIEFDAGRYPELVAS